MSKKNFDKKHHFIHRDPEQGRVEVAKESEKVAEVGKEKEPVRVFEPKTQLAISDFKKNLIVIGVFILIIIGFYLIQTKTELLRPILKVFEI